MWTFFERVRIVVTAVIFMILITGFLVFPAQVAELAKSLDNQEGYIRILLVLGALLADVFLIYSIYREFSSARRYVKGLLVRSADANVQISLESVEENLNTALLKLQDIYEVETDASTDQKGRLNIKMDISANDSVDIAEKTKEITREIERIVEKRMGLKTGAKPEIKFHLLDKAPGTTAPAERKPFGGLFGRESQPAEVPTPAPTFPSVPPPEPIVSTDAEIFGVSSTHQTPAQPTDDEPEINNE